MTHAHQQEPSDPPSEPFQRIQPKEAFGMLAGGDATLVDVRTEAEYHNKHIDNSTLIPVDDVLNRHTELPEKGSLLLICRTGVRSALAAEYLAALGFDTARLFNVEGGIVRWIEDGMAVSSKEGSDVAE